MAPLGKILLTRCCWKSPDAATFLESKGNTYSLKVAICVNDKRNALVFPWANTFGLAKALNDSELWAFVFSASTIGKNSDGARHAVKRIIKKFASTESGVVSIERDESFGLALSALMASPAGRSELYTYLDECLSVSQGRPWIASKLYAFAMRVGKAPTFDEIAEERDDKRAYLHLGKFRNWFRSTSLEGKGRCQAIALAACGFAVLQPELGQDIYDVLASSPDEFSTWINRNEAMSNRKRLRRTKLRGKSVSSRTETPIQEGKQSTADLGFVSDNRNSVTVDSGFCVESPTCLVKQIEDWGDAAEFGMTLSVEQHACAIKSIKEASSRLVLIGQELDSQRSQLELMKKRIGESSSELVKLPWFSTPIECVSSNSSAPTLPLSSAMEQLTKEYALSTQLLDIHRRLVDLYQKLGRPIQALSGACPPTLDAVCAVLSEEAKETESLFKAAVSRESRIAGFIESLTDSPLDDVPSLLADLSEGLCRDILAFTASDLIVSESGKRFASLQGNLEIAGIILGILRDKGVDWLAAAKEANISSAVSDSAGFEKLFRFVDIGGMRDACLELPEMTSHFCALAAGIAIHESKPSALEYTADFLDSSFLSQGSERILGALLELFRRGEFGKALTVARLRGSDKNDPLSKLCNEKKLRLKEMVTSSPGLRKTYHLLRVIAQSEYLTPIEPFLDQDDSKAAIEKWESFGGLDNMVQATIRASDRENEIEPRHRIQTRNYLESFDEALREWGGLRQAVPAAESKRLESLFSELEAGNSDDRELLGIICGRADDVSKTFPHLRLMGEQLLCSKSDGSFSLSNPESHVTALHQLSWPLMVTGRSVPFLTYAADEISGLLIGFRPLTELIDHYLAISEFRSAQEAASHDVSIAGRVNAVIEGKKCELSEQHSELLKEASAARNEDEFVDLLLTETMQSIDELAIERFVECIEQLTQALSEYQSRKDPAYMRLLEFLTECDVVVTPGCSQSDLEAQVAMIKQCEAPRREHLIQLLSLAETHRIAESTKDRIKDLAEKHDLPSRWPSKDNSQLLGEAVGKLSGYIANRLRYHESDDVAECVARSIVVEVETCLTAETEETEDMVFRFSEKVDKIASPGIPEAVVMQLIEEQAAITASWAEGSAIPTSKAAVLDQKAPMVVQPNPRSDSSDRSYRTAELVARVRVSFEPLVRASTISSNKSVSATELSRAIRSERWAEAMQIAASLINDGDDYADPKCLSSAEVAFVVSKTMNDLHNSAENCSADELGLACLAIACSDPTSYSHLITSERISQVVYKIFVWIVFGDSKQITSDQDSLDSLTRTISYLASATDSNKAFVWVNNLFIDASDAKSGELDGGSIIANSLWEWATNKGKNVHEPRSELLGLLYRLRRIRAIESLIRHAAGPRRAEIRLCLQTISKISSDPELRRNAHTKFHALQERSTKQLNTKPWLSFFGKILARDQREGEKLKCSIESDQVAFDENDDGLIEVELTPDAVDPPSELVLTLTTIQEKDRKTVEIQLPLDAEPLLKSRTFTISIPSEFLQSAGEVLRISAHFVGVTALGRPVDLRESWDLPFSSEKLQPIDSHQQRQNWPGASGDPVRKQGGFYGREREFSELESYINDNQRPRSVMVFGQRRIGKTSLLLEMVNLYQPREGRPCGIFVDVAGLELSIKDDSMQRALFSCIASAIDSKAANQQLRDEIKRYSGENARMERLTRSLTPEISLADALQELSNIVNRCTKGKVRRLAIFIDEFDRFVEPLLDGREDQVDRLMRGLREVVQTSHTISLILAGSGLQRMLVDDYGYGFHGSIGELEIKPFELPDDRTAVEATLLPSGIGDRLCPPERRERIIEHGQKLCGGHPYYLAMLGYASAFISRGHPLTPALMNRVVEQMVRGKIPRHITSKKFYSHIFESLKRLPRQDQHVAKIILANIAATTTQEYEWTTKREAIDVPELVGIDPSKRYNMLRALTDERAIVSDEKNSTVKIRVPVTAAALREDSDKIRHEAASFLEDQSVEL